MSGKNNKKKCTRGLKGWGKKGKRAEDTLEAYNFFSSGNWALGVQGVIFRECKGLSNSLIFDTNG
jgi:hypothetical protein